MNQDWKRFLQAAGAHWDEHDIAHFGEDAALDPCALHDLSHLGLIRVTGADAETFLQGQITNDVRELGETHSQLAGYCGPKGRMLAQFRLFRRAGAICLQLPRELLGDTLKRLRMFVLRAQVTLEDVSDDWVRIGLSGECAPGLLSALFDGLPQEANGVLHHQEITLIRMPGPLPRFEILAPPDEAMDLWRRLGEGGARPAGADAWGLLDIRAGLPNVYAGTREAFVPQMTNLQLIDGLSFTKGCYTGQEVVARMQYLGKLKRRMYRARVRAGARPAPGDTLDSPASASGQGAGRVVDARPLGGDEYELLAVVEIAAAENSEVHLGKDGPVLEFLDLPYAFEDAEARQSA